MALIIPPPGGGSGGTPGPHTHIEGDVTNLVTDLGTLTTAVAGKAATVHTHAESDVTGLVADLAGKAATVHTHAQSDVTGLVAALAARPVPLFAYKTADEAVTSSTTMQNDDHLVLAVAASTVYLLEAFLVYDASTASDLEVQWSTPAGTTGSWHPGNVGAAAASSSSPIISLYRNIGQSSTLGGIGTGAGNILVSNVRGLVAVSTTAGNFRLQWAQTTSGATASTIYANSWLRLTPVA